MLFQKLKRPLFRNGTGLQIKRLMFYIIEAIVMTMNSPFSFERLQFFVRMSLISPKELFELIGVDLRK